jgi:hypothetical protein
VSNESRSAPPAEQAELLRGLLCSMQDAIQERVTRARADRPSEELAAVAAITESDTIYEIDRIGERAILDWLEEHWPRQWPVELVMEGIDGTPPRVPAEATEAEVRFTCIVDPIDGTRPLMHDKRSAWVLSALAPGPARGARLRHTFAAAMTELPPTKQTLADQVSAVRGAGAAGVRCERVDLTSGERRPLALRPSRARDLKHGFASFVRFFPDGKVLMAEFEEAVIAGLYGRSDDGLPVVFDDQYISTGGQFYELLAGRDRMLGDLRPQAFARLGRAEPITCHPYDACTALILEEAGCPLGDPYGGPLDFPLDTTSPVSWIGFANAELERHVRPALDAALARFFPR